MNQRSVEACMLSKKVMMMEGLVLYGEWLLALMGVDD